MSTRERTRVVVIGGGFGGAYATRTLQRHAATAGIETTIIDRHNYFIFYPLLVEAGTGSLEPRHAVVSLRSITDGARFRMADVQSVDLEQREVRIRVVGADEDLSLPFDHLVIALGSVTRMPDIEGLSEYGYELKTLADAVALRDRAIALLEQADAIDDAELRRQLLHFVVVGGSYTGVEVVGEFDMFLRRAARQYHNVGPEDIQLTLVEREDRILPTLDEDLADYAAENLRGRGVRLALGESVDAVGEDTVALTGGGTLRARTCIWAAGIAPPPAIAHWGLPLDERGYIACERDMRVRGFESVWAIGDCAANPDKDGKPYPATAQHASRMGVAVAKNILRTLRQDPPQPFDYKTQGTLAALGCRTTVAKVMGVKLSGFVAWWLWRSVYLMKMPGLGRKLRVALDWTADLFFGRDYVQLGVHRYRGAQGHLTRQPANLGEPVEV